jgi:uncharacterized protein (DUF58 family)
MPLEVPAVEGTVRFDMPPLAAGATVEDLVVLPSSRRGVYTVGPASTQRGDPFGLVRREVTWTEPTDFFVHPRTIQLGSLGSGLLKDLEGQTTNDVSVRDLAFHTLREYAPGDDRRHIHWLSTAKRSAAGGADAFMVRQFLDTRRSHIGVVLDCHQASWADPEEFETAASVGASVAVRALLDGMDLTEASGPYLLALPRRHTALDLFSRARLGTEPIEASAARLARAASSVSSVLLITGPLATFGHLLRTRLVFGPDVRVVGLRVEHGAPLTMHRGSGLAVVTVGSLAELPRALAATMRT